MTIKCIWCKKCHIYFFRRRYNFVLSFFKCHLNYFLFYFFLKWKLDINHILIFKNFIYYRNIIEIRYELFEWTLIWFFNSLQHLKIWLRNIVKGWIKEADDRVLWNKIRDDLAHKYTHLHPFLSIYISHNNQFIFSLWILFPWIKLKGASFIVIRRHKRPSVFIHQYHYQ